MEVLTPPTKPYMIALGTSHTNGDCEEGDYYSNTLQNGKKVNLVQKTAYQRVAEELGLEIVQLGLSGCGNMDLLEATNELSNKGFLNNNCKLFILEPRCIDNTVKLPQEFFEELPNKDWVLGHKINSILEGWGPRRGYDNKEYRSAIQQIAHEVNVTIPKNYTEIFPNADLTLIQKASEVHIFSAGTAMQLHEHLVHIESIKNIVISNNINFKWQTWNSIAREIKMCKHILGPSSTLFDYFIGEISPDAIQEKFSKTFYCSCGHYNEKGHINWYNNIIEDIKLSMK